jgi:thiamine pyrophosphokinase
MPLAGSNGFAPGATLSIVPIGGDVVGVSNSGLQWPLHDATLPFGSTRGISNVFLSNEATVSVRAGIVLCIINHPSHLTEAQEPAQFRLSKL